MRDVNWWLMLLAFLLGLVLTLGLMIRRVTREVPVTHTVSAGLSKPDLGKAAAGVATAAGATAATLSGAAGKVEKKVENLAEKATAKIDAAAEKATARIDAAAEKATAKIDDVLEHDPYGTGSIRVTRRSAAPAGYTIKGDKDTGRYFTLDSPEYDAIEAEVWFANEESAAKAGFLRWDAKAGSQAVDPGADAAKLVVHGGSATETHAVITGGDQDAPAAVVHESAPVDTEAKVRFAAAAAGAEGVFGKGSIKALADGSGPAGWTIKGNADSMLFHTPESPAYDVTIAEVWFVDEATARAAGFQHWDKKRR